MVIHRSPVASRARRALALVVSLVALAGTARPSAAATPAGSDPKAIAVADRVMQALGGEAAWNATRYLRFDFAVDRGGKTVMRRAHAWDKWTGRYRVEGKDKDGRDVVVAMNLNTKEGSATVGGRPLAGEELKGALETGYAWWVNDAYWLVMPYKMRDPGVVLALAGTERKGEDAWDKVLLTFEGVGLTPKDRLLGVRQREDLSRGPLGVRAEGREDAARPVRLEGLEGPRQDPAGRRPREPEGRDAYPLPRPRRAGVPARRGVHDRRAEAVAPPTRAAAPG